MGYVEIDFSPKSLFFLPPVSFCFSGDVITCTWVSAKAQRTTVNVCDFMISSRNIDLTLFSAPRLYPNYFVVWKSQSQGNRECNRTLQLSVNLSLDNLSSHVENVLTLSAYCFAECLSRLQSSSTNCRTSRSTLTRCWHVQPNELTYAIAGCRAVGRWQ